MSEAENEQDERARKELIAAADLLRAAQLKVNEYGDAIDLGLACSGPGYCYGYVSLALGQLLRAVYPDDGVKNRADKIIDEMIESGIGVEDAARVVADRSAPMFGYSDDEIRSDLAKYRAWLVALRDGVLDPVNVVGGGYKDEDPYPEAERWLLGQIQERTAALAYRKLPDRVEATLLADWLAERLVRLLDDSTDFYGDAGRAIDAAKAKAKAFGIAWDDSMIPGWVQERLGDA